MQRFLNSKSISVLIFIFSITNTVLGQTETSIPLAEIIAKAGEQRKVYVEEFKNLLSQETKKFEIYDKKGAVKKSRTVTSTFIVYQLSKGDNLVAEYRHVIAVDGKPLDNADKRAQDFFEKIARAESQNSELAKLHDESTRFDQEILVDGFTLFQSVALVEKVRPFIEFRLEGREILDGTEVLIVSYRQTRQSPFIVINSKKGAQNVTPILKYDVDLEDDVDFRERLSGKFWIDAKTFQVWREERLMTVQPGDFAVPVPLAEDVFEFQKSEFGILTPKKISHTQYELKKKDRVSIKEGRVVFEYEKFTKPDVEVKSTDVKN